MTTNRAVLAAWVAAMASLLTTPPLSATTYHVSPDGSGDFPNIQAAIDAAASGDEIVLADGTFTGDGNWDLDFGTKDLVLRSENGYAQTFLDGGFDCLYADAIHRAVVLDGGQTSATRIEGITFQRFLPDAGVVRIVGTAPVLSRCRFWMNHGYWNEQDGRDIVVQSASPSILDCVFQGDICTPGWRDGMAVYARASSVAIERCSFSAVNGRSTVNLDGGTFVDCFFEQNRGGDNDGQGKCVRVVAGQASFQGCRFEHNFGEGVSVDAPAQVVIGSCLFDHNVADIGAAVFSSGTSTTIRNTTFRHNYSGYGGGIVSVGDAVLEHCVFIDNTNGYPGWASAVSASGTVQITHCTFVGNRSVQPGYRGSTLTLYGRIHFSMDHTIIALGGQAGLPDGAIHCNGTPASLFVSCCDIYGNEGGDWTGCIAGMDEANKNLSADPLFCDLAAGDASIHGNSPCAPANSGECGLIGALGPWCGPLAVEPRTWGSIKALYR